jgi:hypothetical protein
LKHFGPNQCNVRTLAVSRFFSQVIKTDRPEEMSNWVGDFPEDVLQVNVERAQRLAFAINLQTAVRKH